MDYQVVAGDDGLVIKVDSSQGQSVIVLPTPTAGFKVTIKDMGGLASLNRINIIRNGSEMIDGVADDTAITENGAALSFVADGTNWSRFDSFIWVPARNAGRAIISLGWDGSYNNIIEYFSIPTLGNSTDFGDLTSARGFHSAASSSTRGLIAGGNTTNIIDYVTIATTGNAIDFGDLTSTRDALAGASNATRAVFAGGSSPHGAVIDYVTIATLGNAASFGTLTDSRDYLSACASTTRGIYSGAPSPGGAGVIQYITFATTGNSVSFGNSSVARYGGATGTSSATRGIFSGGYITAVDASNVIDYITMATTGNATDFGDLTQARQEPAGASNRTRGVTMGGGSNAQRWNIIDYITIATTGNAADFGDLTQTCQGAAGCSDAHGGL